MEKLAPPEEARVTVYPVGLDAYQPMRECCSPITTEPMSSEYNCINLEPAIH